MSITAQERQDLVLLINGVFGAAPSSRVLSNLVKLVEEGSTVAQVATMLTNNANFESIYAPALLSSEFATKFAANLLGSAATTATTARVEALVLSYLNAGDSRTEAVWKVTQLLSTTSDADFATAKAQLNNKAEVSLAFALDTQYTELMTLAQLQSVISSVTSDTATVTTAKASITAGTAVTGSSTGSVFTLTTSVDTLTGTSANDTFNASVTSTSAVLGGLDSIDGGAGNDTVNITDTSVAAGASYTLPTGMTIKNVETLNVVANGSVGTGALDSATAFDVSGMTGLTTFKATAAGTIASSVKAAGTTDVAITVANGTTVVNGGKTVSITGGTAATVRDVAGATGTTLTSVSLTNVGTAGAQAIGLTGNGLTSVTLSGVAAASNTVTVTNATANHSLTINAAGTGYTTAAATTAAATAVTDTVATSLTVNTTAKSAVNASGSTAVKSVTLTGAGDLVFTPMAAATTTIDGSAATGSLTLGSLNAAVTSVKTGSGNDSLTVTGAKITVDTGAGNDTLTLGGALAAGSTITLGAGNDTLLGGTVVAASTTTATTTIDAGEGTDSVASTLINAGNAAQFKNFELVSIGNATVDIALLTASTITGVSIDDNTGTGTLLNVSTSQGLAVNANNGGTSSTLTFKDATGSADAYNITFNASTSGTTATPATVDAKIVSVEGIETVNVHSGSAAGVNANAIALKDAAATSLVIDGNQALTVTFNTAFGTTGTNTGVSTINGSAATGKLDIDVANVNAAAAGLTVSGGSAADTLTSKVGASVTFTGNAGNDTFEVAATLAGTTDAATANIVTITDFTAGDKLDTVAVTGSTFTTAKVNVSAAISLDTAVDIAVAGDGSTNAIVSWFNYGSDTYVVVDTAASATLAAGDQIIKLTGTLDLSSSTYDAATGTITFA